MTAPSASILLVEDNEDDQILIKAAFESAGINCDLVAVGSAEEAMAYLSQQGAYADPERFPIPAVILTDLTLPGKSGHELLKWIQARPDLKGLVRVVLSGSDNPEDVNKSYQLGAHGYLMKPLTAAQLMQPGRTLKMVLSRRNAAPDLVPNPR